VKFRFFIQELLERKSLHILYECWQRAYHALLGQLFINFRINLKRSLFMSYAAGGYKLEHLYIWHIFWEISRLSIPITVWSLKWIGKGVLNLQRDIRKIALESRTIWWIKSHNSGKKMGLYSSNCMRFFVCRAVNWEPLGQFTSNFAQLLELIVLRSVFFDMYVFIYICEIWKLDPFSK
jgi:hypothetical protein